MATTVRHIEPINYYTSPPFPFIISCVSERRFPDGGSCMNPRHECGPERQALQEKLEK